MLISWARRASLGFTAWCAAVFLCLAPAPAATSAEDLSARLGGDVEVLAQDAVRTQGQNRERERKLLRTSFKYAKVLLTTDRVDGNVTGTTATVGDHILVRLQKGKSRKDLDTACKALGLQVRKALRTPGLFLVSVPQLSGAAAGKPVDLNLLDDARRRLAEAKDIVAGSELDTLVFLDDTPNDPRYAEMWALNNTGQTGGTTDADIDAPEAWTVTTGSSAVTVGVIDTGIDYTHPDLAPNIWNNPGEIPGNGADDDANGFIDDVHGWDFYNDDANPMDDHYHGTHVAGTIGARGNNGVHCVGVNWQVSLVALKFLSSSGSGTTSDAIDAVNYATLVGVDLTSNSWGGGGFSQTLKDAIAAAGLQGILFVAAAGNNGINTDSSPHYPSSYNEASIISVAASTHNDARASFSNYGLVSVDLAAPGENILSLSPGNSTRTISGTSMACPHVSGVCALLYALNPALTSAQVKQALLDNVDPLPAWSSITVAGGRLNAYKALQAVNPGSQGEILFDKAAYTSSGAALLRVLDGDLADQTSVDVQVSTSGGDVETVNLLRLATGVGIFQGTVALSASPTIIGDGTLQFAHLETITATYLDADDGTGQPAIATDTALADCQAPALSAVQAGSITSYSATVTFATDEPATSQVRYATSMAGPFTTASGPLATSHAVPLAGLLPGTTYFFAVDATDTAGNAATDDQGGAGYQFTTLEAPTDYFTELFSSSDNDLDNKSLIFIPDGSANFYAAYRVSTTTLPTDPSGGTSITLGDDTYATIPLAGSPVKLYGTSYGTMYVGSNGYITFGSGSSSLSESIATHFSLPRIAGLFDDLYPRTGNVTYKVLPDRVTVTYLNVPEYSSTGSNTFQIDMYFDGVIRITWLGITALDGLAGLSKGTGTPVNFTESNLSNYPLVQAPAITAPSAIPSTLFNTPVDIQFTGTSTLPFAWSLASGSLPPGMTFNTATGQYSGSPTTPGNYTFQIAAENYFGRQAKTYTHSIVTLPPTLAVNETLVLNEGAQAPIGNALLNTTDPDTAATGIVYTIQAVPLRGTLRRSTTVLGASSTFTQNDVNLGLVSYTHNGTQTSSDAFTFKVKDESTTLPVATFQIAINTLNDAPKANAGGFTTPEDQVILGNLIATDEENDPLQYEVVAQGAKGQAVITNPATGAFLYVPGENLFGGDTFTFRVHDGEYFSNVATISINILSVNDGPETLDEEFALYDTEQLSGENVLANDSDGHQGAPGENNQPLTAQLVDGPLFAETFSFAPDGTFSYAPSASVFTTADFFVYRAYDALGALSRETLVTIHVLHKPVANDDSANADEGQSVNIGVADNDTDADGDLDLASIQIVTGAAHGSLQVNTDGTVDYTHDGSESFSDSFTYTIKDASAATSNTAAVSITIGPVNDRPVAEILGSGLLYVEENEFLPFNGTGTDVEDGTNVTYSWDWDDGSGNGSAQNPSHAWDAPGTYTVTLVVTDQDGLASDPVTVQVIVTPKAGERDLFLKRGKFVLDWKAHAGGAGKDTFLVQGCLNPAGCNADLTDAAFELGVNGVSLGAIPLSSTGKGSAGDAKVSLKAKTGAFTFSLKNADLRAALGLDNADEAGSVELAIEITVRGAGLDTETFAAHAAFTYATTQDVASKGAFNYKLNASSDGYFFALKTTVSEDKAGAHKVSVKGYVEAPGGASLAPAGDVTLEIGAQSITIPATSLTVAGGVVSLTKGAHPDLAKFVLDTNKKQFAILTNALAGTGVPPAGDPATAHDLLIRVAVPTAGDPVAFQTIIELLRSSPTSTKWKR